METLKTFDFKYKRSFDKSNLGPKSWRILEELEYELSMCGQKGGVFEYYSRKGIKTIEISNGRDHDSKHGDDCLCGDYKTWVARVTSKSSRKKKIEFRRYEKDGKTLMCAYDFTI